MRAALRGSGGTRLTLVEVETEADEVEWRVLPAVRDAVGLLPDRDRLRRRESAVPELLEEWEEPLLTSQGGSGVCLGKSVLRALERCPRAL